MKNLTPLMADVLKKIKPNVQEKNEMQEIADKIIEKVKEISKPYSAKPLLCGSAAKNTWIKDKRELDLFLLFNPVLNKDKLSEYGLKIAKETISEFKGKYKISYAEHPYLTGTIAYKDKEYKIDIVPCYAVKDSSKIKSAVDRTPYHVEFVKKNLKFPDEVRILKQFLKSIKIYGADVKTQGFSGYLTELLIINYGYFSNMVQEAAKWRAPIAIDIKGSIDSEKAHAKFKSPLVLIDPVDPERNVAAAISEENFYRFVKGCNDFLKNPTLKFFFQESPKPYTAEEVEKEIKGRGTRWYLIRFNKPDVIDDILWPQLRRCINSVEGMITDSGFRVFRKNFWVGDEIVLAFETDIWLVPKIEKHVGPNVYSKHAENFLKHYDNYKIFIENKNWVLEKDREFITILHLLQALVKMSEKKLAEKGIPSKLVSNFRKAEISSGDDATKMMRRLPDDFRVFMRNWFEEDFSII